MSKKNTPLRDIKSNIILVLGLAVILIVAAYIYVPTVKEELSPGPSEAFDAFDLGGSLPGEGDIFDDNDDVWLPEIIAPWKPEGEETVIVSGYHISPDIHDNIIVYGKRVGWHEFDFYMKDLSTNEETLIAKLAGTGGHIYDNYIIWTKGSEELDEFGFPAWSNIFMIDLSQPDLGKINITNIDTIHHQIISSAIYKNIIIWAESSEGQSFSVMSYNIDTEGTTTVRPWSDYSKLNVDIYKNIVVWSERTSLNQFNTQQAIYIADLNNPGVSTMVDSPDSYSDQRNPAIYRDWVVWSASLKTQVDIYMKNITTGEPTINLTNGNGGFEHPNVQPGAFKLAIHQNIIVWNNYKHNTDTGWYISNVWLHRIDDPIGQNHQLTDTSPKASEDIYGPFDIFDNKIVWQKLSLDDPGIYMFEITNL